VVIDVGLADGLSVHGNEDVKRTVVLSRMSPERCVSSTERVAKLSLWVGYPVAYSAAPSPHQRSAACGGKQVLLDEGLERTKNEENPDRVLGMHRPVVLPGCKPRIHADTDQPKPSPWIATGCGSSAW
jgi:hypothetical protein